MYLSTQARTASLADICELAQTDSHYCETILDDLEALEQARDSPTHFVWLG